MGKDWAQITYLWEVLPWLVKEKSDLDRWLTREKKVSVEGYWENFLGCWNFIKARYILKTTYTNYILIFSLEFCLCMDLVLSLYVSVHFLYLCFFSQISQLLWPTKTAGSSLITNYKELNSWRVVIYQQTTLNQWARNQWICVRFSYTVRRHTPYCPIDSRGIGYQFFCS